MLNPARPVLSYTNYQMSRVQEEWAMADENRGYGRRNWKKLLAIYVVVGAVIYALVYLILFAGGSSSGGGGGGLY
jgi:hypothetical protein